MGAVKDVFSGPPKPTPPPPPPEPPAPPKQVDEQVTKRRDLERRRAALALGRDSTILTSPQGLPSLQSRLSSFKTLLGE